MRIVSPAGRTHERSGTHAPGAMMATRICAPFTALVLLLLLRLQQPKAPNMIRQTGMDSDDFFGYNSYSTLDGEVKSINIPLKSAAILVQLALARHPYSLVKKRFLKCRIVYCPNVSASFNPSVIMLDRSGINLLNPGPVSDTGSGSSNPRCQTSSNRLKCALINSRSLKAFCNDPVTGTKTCKLTLFKNLVYSNSYDIIAVTETWLNETVSDGEIIDQGYSIYRRDRQGKRGGGVLLAVRSNIASNRRHDFENNIETVCVELQPADSHKIFISVVYRPPDADISFMDKFSELISNLQHIHRSKCVLLGDFNLPNINWINSFGFSNSQHEFAFTECLKDNGLFQLNTSSTHFTPLNNEGKIPYYH